MTKVTRDHCLEIITKFEPCSHNQKQGLLGIDGKSIWISWHCEASGFCYQTVTDSPLKVLTSVEMFDNEVLNIVKERVSGREGTALDTGSAQIYQMESRLLAWQKPRAWPQQATWNACI